MLELLPVLVLALLVGMAAVRTFRLVRRASSPRRSPFLLVLLVSVLVLPVLGAAAFKISKSRDFQFFGKIVSRVQTPDHVVALTFDDGPTELTPRVLRVLTDHGVRATFFVTGAELEQQPALGKEIAAAGHELGNHSYSHRRMIATSYAFVRQEVERTDALIRKTGYSGPIHFRPPYFKKFLILPFYLARTGRKTITADVEPDSSEGTKDPQWLVEQVRRETRPGSIILLHVMYPSRQNSLAAVPGVIEGLRQDGYRFVTVSELLEHAGSR